MFIVKEGVREKKKSACAEGKILRATSRRNVCMLSMWKIKLLAWASFAHGKTLLL